MVICYIVIGGEKAPELEIWKVWAKRGAPGDRLAPGNLGNKRPREMKQFTQGHKASDTDSNRASSFQPMSIGSWKLMYKYSSSPVPRAGKLWAVGSILALRMLSVIELQSPIVIINLLENTPFPILSYLSTLLLAFLAFPINCLYLNHCLMVCFWENLVWNERH